MADLGLWVAVGLGFWFIFVIITTLTFIHLDSKKNGLGGMLIAFIIAKIIFIIGMCSWLFYGTYLIWN